MGEIRDGVTLPFLYIVINILWYFRIHALSYVDLDSDYLAIIT